MTDTTAFAFRADPLPEDFLDLMKPRVMSLVIFTAFAGMLLAPSSGAHPVLLAIALCSIAVGAGASGALNMAFDAKIDAMMARTASRPVPAGRVSKDAALTFGLILSAGSVMTLWLSTNLLAAALLAFTIFFYAVIYTLVLKHRTPQNIVIGGAAGALPPVVAWAAATGTVALEPLILFLIVFLWTPAHFWALAILKRDEYRRAGVPMLPVVASASATRWNILVYAILTGLSGVLPTLFGFASIVYAAGATVLGLWFVQRSYVLLRADAQTERAAAGRVFAVSILYLFVLFGLLMVDHAVAMVL